MDDGGPTASIILFIALLLIDMFFYGFGSAIHSLNIKEIKKKENEDRDKKSHRLRIIMENPTQYVNTVQLIVTLVNIIMGGFYLGIWLKGIKRFITGYIGLGEAGSLPVETGAAGMLALMLTVIFLIYILLIFGVLLPKKLAAKYPDQWAYLSINTIYFVTKALSPVTGLVTITTNGILRLFGIKEDNDNSDVTEAEIISMVNEGHVQGVLQAAEAEMITNIFEFGDKEARDIMTNRNSMVAVEGNMLLKEAIRFMLEANNSRFPVYEENIDRIIGIVHLRDAMRIHSMNEDLNLPLKDVEGVLRRPVFIPETKNIDALFQTMQSSKMQMVVVVDEYGQTAGLLAMEDILEEIVGNILDEYDEDEDYIEETDNVGEYIIEGKTPLDELEERFSISFEEEEFETLNGFLISKLDRIPDKNEEFEIDVDGYTFRIISVENKMIQSVLVTKIVQKSKAEDALEEIEEEKEK